MPDAPRAATFAFASSRDRLQRLGRRVDALGAGCEARIGALVDRLARLPEAATFEPFAAVAAPSAEAAQERAGNVAAPRRRRAPPVASAQRASAAAGATSRAAVAPTATATLARSAAQPAGRGQGVRPLSGQASAATTTRVPGTRPTSQRAEPPLASSVAGTLVVQMLSQWVAPGPSAPLEAAAQATLSAQQVLQQQLQALAPRGARASTATGLLPTRTSDRKATTPAAAAGTTAAREQAALPAHAQQAAPLPPLDPSAAAALTPLTGLAPRAASKLLTAAAPAAVPTTTRTGSTQAPAAAADPEAQQADLLASMNRLLIDQAWLRGVDLR